MSLALVIPIARIKEQEGEEEEDSAPIILIPE